nr:IS30 family transposase [Vibrio sp. SS-MA-C1-2]
MWFVKIALLWDWSPEQISYIAKSLTLKVSHEWICRYVLKDKMQGGTLYQYLRQGHKKYRKGKQAIRGKIRHCVFIDECPNYINDKSRLGDWEADLVLGKQGTGAIVTLA